MRNMQGRPEDHGYALTTLIQPKREAFLICFEKLAPATERSPPWSVLVSNLGMQVFPSCTTRLVAEFQPLRFFSRFVPCRRFRVERSLSWSSYPSIVQPEIDHNGITPTAQLSRSSRHRSGGMNRSWCGEPDAGSFIQTLGWRERLNQPNDSPYEIRRLSDAIFPRCLGSWVERRHLSRILNYSCGAVTNLIDHTFEFSCWTETKVGFPATDRGGVVFINILH